ncbi:histone [Candidatus Protochlamydia phocaeensis]|uniref:histone H1-like protein HctA n=1 Tax=Candidatus Protochlamydia phocaeensis TaxID=1414722 RepID=UPI0008399353|nr:histone [Candidatus Protochlamydia phocaeensis]
MSLKDTFKQMRELLANITQDLEKSENGNKAASQRVRTGTVKLEKIAKLFRKESISSEKKNKGQKKPARSASGAASSKGKSSASAGASKAKSAGGAKSKAGAASKSKSSAAVKAKPKAKSAKASTSFRARQMSVKRATAKLPTRRVAR